MIVARYQYVQFELSISGKMKIAHTILLIIQGFYASGKAGNVKESVVTDVASLKNLLRERNYSKHDRPNTDGPADEVRVRVIIFKVGPVDEVKMTMSVTFLLQMWWQDVRLNGVKVNTTKEWIT